MGTSPVEKSIDCSMNAQEGSTASTAPEEFTWTVENEVHLFNAMLGNKPAGINKHFNMALICEKFASSVNKTITSECIWKYLEDLYNFEILDDIEGIPFPNEEKDFSLPESEYGTLMKQKLKDISNKVEEPEDRSASPRALTSRSASRGAASKENASKPSAKKDSEKSTKAQNTKDSTGNDKSSDSLTTPTKTDPRRDSKDSTSSNKDSSKTPAGSTKTPKDKPTKTSRASVADKADDSTKSSDDSSSAKRSFKRSTRGSLKSEEPTPPSRRRRI